MQPSLCFPRAPVILHLDPVAGSPLGFSLRPLEIPATDTDRPRTPHNSYVRQQNVNTMPHVSQVPRGRENQFYLPQRPVIILLCLIGVFHTLKLYSRCQQEIVAS